MGWAADSLSVADAVPGPLRGLHNGRLGARQHTMQALAVAEIPLPDYVSSRMSCSRGRPRLVVMTARMIEEAEQRLHELRQDEWSSGVVAAFAMALSLGASFVRPAFAIPFFLGALMVGLRSGRALFERADLAHHLMLERDAHTITEIRESAEKVAMMESRLVLAAAVRCRLEPLPGYRMSERMAAVAGGASCSPANSKTSSCCSTRSVRSNARICSPDTPRARCTMTCFRSRTLASRPPDQGRFPPADR